MPTDPQKQALKVIADAAVASERCTEFPAEISTAQCVVESGWLSRAPGNNCFGIKNTDRYPGSQYVVTKEYINGEWVKQPLAFEVYPTLADCFTDHARLLTGGFDPKHPNVYAPAWLAYKQDRNLDKLIAGIAKHYATDPGYAKAITTLAHGPNITAAIAAARSAAHKEEISQ